MTNDECRMPKRIPNPESRMSDPGFISALGIRHSAFGIDSDAEAFRIPRKAQLARRSHIADERGGRYDRGAREVPFASEPHPVLPVPVERRNGALAWGQRVRPLAEARTAPRLADVAADGAEHV